MYSQIQTNAGQAEAANMSAENANLQAQVEAVLGTLVKAATVELVKMFESRFQMSALSPTQRAGGKEASELTGSLSTGGTKRSVGVQVETQGIYGLLVPPSDEDCSKDYREGKQQEDALHHSQIAPALKQQVVDGKEQHGSAQSSATKNKVLVVRLNACDSISPEKVQFVCPLIRNSESLPPKREKAVMAEPQQGCVSTSRGSAYRPSLSDGSLTPAEVGVWERVPTPKEKNDLHMKLKLTSPDQKLTRPCRVHLVDVLTVQRSERALWDCDARGQTLKGLDGGRKDVRHHQGLHTGHRICCFSPCGNGIWRLKKVAAHAHTGGYVCSVCHKTFARRKVLRRHQRFHSGEKPYSCPACSKSFALRKSLRRHTRFHTGERPHVCTRCDKSFRLRENLKAHLRFHTGEKPFSCPTCGKMFRMVRNLEKHECPPAFVPSFRAIAGL